MAATAAQTIFSIGEIARTYRKLADHQKTRRHIERYSENRNDIRDIALQDLELSSANAALDLGCSYGFFTEKLARRLKPGTKIIGIDLVDQGCRDVFLRTVSESGCTGRFITAHADCIAGMPSVLFDIVCASYSLYFFPHLISDIARILKPGGLFIAITHSQKSLREIIRLIPATCSRQLAISRLLRLFSAENGTAQLRKNFALVERLPYPNRLVFPHESIEDCCDYLFKKRELLFKDIAGNRPRELDRAAKHFLETIRQHAEQQHSFTITKDDCVFRCRNPKHLTQR